MLDIYTLSSSPANDDKVGAIRFYGEDSNSDKTLYAMIQGRIEGVTHTTELGKLNFYTALNGSTAQVDMTLSSGGALNVYGAFQSGAAMAATVAYNRFGATATGHSLNSDDDLMVSGELEVDGEAFFDEKVTITGVASNDRFLVMSNWNTPWLDADNTTYYGTNNSVSLYKTASAYTGKVYGYLQYVNVYYNNSQDWTDSLSIEGIHSQIITRTSTSGTITGAACFTAKLNQQVALIDHYYGYYMYNQTGSTVTNQYGVYIEDLTRGTNNYGIYIAGASTAAIFVATGDQKFGGSVDSAAVADQVSIGGYELGAGQRALAISQEYDVIGDADESKFSHKLPVRINGATKYIMLTDS